MELDTLFSPDTSPCPACGSAMLKPWLNKEITGVTFHLDKCCACGTGYVNPPPSMHYIKSIYSVTGHGAKSLTSFDDVMASEREFPNSTVDAKRMVTYAAQLLGSLRAGQRRALDIGSGYGFFTQAALNQGFKVVAVNPAISENQIFKQLNGFDPIPQFFEEIDFGPEKFDLVILSQILEHLLNPQQVLARIRRLLKQDGILFIAVPNVDALLIKILKSKSSFLGLPEHIIHFSKKGLEAILETSGFEPKFHRYVSRIPYYAVSNRLHLRGLARKCLNYGVRIGQWAPLWLANQFGLGLFQNVWAAPAPPKPDTSA